MKTPRLYHRPLSGIVWDKVGQREYPADIHRWDRGPETRGKTRIGNVFRGQHRHTVDEKGRLSIPSKFREALETAFEAPLFVTVMDNCLVAYPADEWRALEAKLNELSQFDERVQRFRRVVYASAQECPLDKAGRILLPPILRERAGLVRDVVIAGMARKFEIWDATRHENMMEASLADLPGILKGVGEIGI